MSTTKGPGKVVTAFQYVSVVIPSFLKHRLRRKMVLDSMDRFDIIKFVESNNTNMFLLLVIVSLLWTPIIVILTLKFLRVF